ncbi:alpha/beta fold hydrolase [Winogradskyella sp.]|uniref:alpha/beta fold hydrolase n=1 Tax=Winogradskyella sp. TaxID=1883156 RepID=UPI0026373838|nr:alpha/beta fold hydrolase [Winogradskyella sp.]
MKHHHRIKLWILLLGTILITNHLSSQSLHDWAGLSKGKFNVGFKVLTESDTNRKMGDSERPMNLGVWYPADVTSVDQAIKYKAYIATRAYEDSLGGGSGNNKSLEKAFIDHFRNSAIKKGGSEKSITKDFEHLTLAHNDAKPTVGDFPVIVYAPGLGGSIYENSILFEYLASHGYVIFSMPSNGKGPNMTYDLEGLKTAVEDLVWTRNFLDTVKTSYTKSNKVGLIGYSWGGLASAIVTSVKKPDSFDAFISFDGTISYEDGMGRDNFQGYSGKELKIPFLYTLAWGDHQNFNFFKEGNSERYLLKFQKMGHRNFNSDAIMTMDRPSPPDLVEFYKRKGAEIEASYGLLCQFSKAFLDKTLKNNPALLKSLQKQTKKTNDFDEAIYFTKKTDKYSEKNNVFTKLLQKRNFIGAINNYYEYVINSTKKLSLFDEEELLDIALGDFNIKEAKSARETGILLWINSRENPQSAKAFYELGNYYVDFTPENYNNAIRYYQMALDIDPNCKEAKNKIDQLKKAEKEN